MYIEIVGDCGDFVPSRVLTQATQRTARTSRPPTVANGGQRRRPRTSPHKRISLWHWASRGLRKRGTVTASAAWTCRRAGWPSRSFNPAEAMTHAFSSRKAFNILSTVWRTRRSAAHRRGRDWPCRTSPQQCKVPLGDTRKVLLKTPTLTSWPLSARAGTAAVYLETSVRNARLSLITPVIHESVGSR